MKLVLGLVSTLVATSFLPSGAAQKGHGKQEVECRQEHAVLGIGGKCKCSKGFVMKENNDGVKMCKPANMHIDPKCEPGHECGRECFDGIDNDHDGKKDCADKDCQFDPMARKHCKEVNYGTRENGFGGGRECLLTEKGKEAKDELQRLENYCCPAGNCEKTPDTCSKRCSRVFIPFWTGCRAKFHNQEKHVMSKDHLEGLDRLFPLCERTELAQKQAEEQAEEAGFCDYQNYLATALDCAEYISGEEKLSFGSTKFCRTKCFEQVFEFERKCGAAMSPLMQEGLKTVLPYTSQCAHMIEGNQVKCNVPEERAAIEHECGQSIDTICETKCAKMLKTMSNRCSTEPELQKYEGAEKKCSSTAQDHNCASITPHFTRVFQQNCCGKDKCATKLPNTCSVPCAESFIPYFSQCGKAQYGKDQAQLQLMDGFAGVCAETLGRHNNHDDGALPHVSGPDPSDPCDKKKSCGSCGGKCGWCRDEATQQQLAGTKHKGWCSSKCITTRDECGRNTKPDHGGH